MVYNQNGWGDTGSYYDYNEAITEYLAALLKTAPAEMGLKSAWNFSEEWKGAPALTKRLSQLRSETIAKYQSVVSHLVDAGLLSEPEAAELAPQIEMRLSDLRRDQSVPLPDPDR
jgi:hypothetical protein